MLNGQYQQNQLALPVPPNQLVGQFLNIQFGQAPYLPQQLPVQGYEQQFVPQLVSLLVMEIQNKAKANALRTFMFNWFSRNNYANQEFDGLVCAVVEYIHLGIAKRVYGDFPSAMQDAAVKVTEMVAAAQLKQYGQIAAYLPDTLRQPIMNLINSFDQIGREIMQLNQQRGMMMQQQPMNNNAMFYQGGQQMMQGQLAMNTHMGTMAQGGGMVNTGGSFFSNTQTSAGARPGERMGRQMADDANSPFMDEVTFTPAEVVKQPFEARPANTVPPRAVEEPSATFDNDDAFNSTWKDDNQVTESAPAKTTSNLVSAAESKVKFTGNAKQPYAVAYNPNKHVLFHQIAQDGTVGLVLQAKGELMDLEKLETRKPVGDHGMIGVGSKQTDMNEVWGAVAALNDKPIDSDAANPEDLAETNVVVDNGIGFHTSLDSAILATRLDHMRERLKRDIDIPVYETYVNVASLVTLPKDYNPMLDRLGQSEGYVSLAKRMHALRGDLPDLLWYTVEQIMTSTINNVLKRNLGIEGLEITSFTQDVEELIAHLEKTPYGGAIYLGFVNNQQEVIRSTLGSLNQEDRDWIVENLVSLDDIPEEKKPVINAIGQVSSITILDCRAHELEIDINDDVGTAILPDVTPELYKLVEGIFKRADSIENHLAHHFIITNDNRIFATTRGHINKEFFLLALVK